MKTAIYLFTKGKEEAKKEQANFQYNHEVQCKITFNSREVIVLLLNEIKTEAESSTSRTHTHTT